MPATRSRTLALLAAALTLALASATALAEPSNKWRIEVSSDADSTGVLVFELAPVNAPVETVTVNVADDTGENAVARLIRDAMRAQLGGRYQVEVDDGEDVLVKKAQGAADFDLRLREQSVRGVRIDLDRE